MVAGASGIDLFLLVIDAGEGARPQTHEHLAILRLLGIEHGVVALTKADAVDEETLELARVEAEELVPGAPVVATSARSGTGLDELRAALVEVAAGVSTARRRGADATPRRPLLHPARDRNGRDGDALVGDDRRGRRAARRAARPLVRVRSVQVHDRPVERAEAGQRVAVALPGVERRELRRGDVLVTPGAFRPSFRLDVTLEPLGDVPPRVMLHHGTAETAARVARAGDRFAQLRLSRPVVAARGDRVVLRAGTTVGGGVVLDPNPPRHADLARFEALERGETLVHAPVRVDGEWRWSPEWLDELRAELDRALDAADPLDPGVPVPAADWAKAVVPHLGLELRGAKLYRPGAAAGLGGREEEAAALEAQLGVEPVRVEDAQLARFLEEQGRLVRVGDGFAISPAAYEQARAVLVDGITLAQLRDALGVGRKTAQLYLERFDADGVTRRFGDTRACGGADAGSVAGRAADAGEGAAA